MAFKRAWLALTDAKIIGAWKQLVWVANQAGKSRSEYDLN
jgi:hypothetical protein